jgi:subtilisin
MSPSSSASRFDARALKSAVGVRLPKLARKKLQPVEVAVLDSGVDGSHADLRGRIVESFAARGEAEAVKMVARDPGKNGDDFGHGTAVASIIARLAPNARIIDVRVLGPDNSGSGHALVRGLELAIERGFRIINMSLAAKAAFAPRLNALCEQAYRNGQIVVAAKRNMPLVDNGFPAEFSSAISVERKSFKQQYQVRFRHGDSIEFEAHGSDVVVAAPGGGYTVKTGTSFATPAVAACCALLVGAYPGLRPFEVKTLLKAVGG